MVDADRLGLPLERMERERAGLARTAERSDRELLSEPDALPAAKYRLIVAVEAATDVTERAIEIVRTRLDDLDRFVAAIAERLRSGGPAQRP